MVLITVSDPRVENPDTRSSFTTYLVSTKEGNEVRRRYSDFRWLYQRLQTEVPGAIVPVIPHTRTIMSSKKFNPEFIDARRRDLQEFIEAISEHAELCRAPSMTPFMVLELGEAFDMGKKNVENSKPTTTELTVWSEDTEGEADGKLKSASVNLNPKAAQKGITNFFAKMRLSTGSQELLATQNEREVRALQGYISEINAQVKSLTKASDSLLMSTADAAIAHHELGVPIHLWKTAYMQLNDPEDQLVKDMMTGIGKFSDEMSSILRNKHKEEDFLFGHTVHKLSNTVSAFEMALYQRKKAQIDYTHAQNVFIEKNAALEKAQKSLKPPAVTDKLMKERIEVEAKAERKRQNFENITGRLLKDANVYKPKLIRLLKESFLMLTKAQLSYNTRMNEAYGRLVSVLEGSGPSTTIPASTLSSQSGSRNGHLPPSAPPTPPDTEGNAI